MIYPVKAYRVKKNSIFLASNFLTFVLNRLNFIISYISQQLLHHNTALAITDDKRQLIAFDIAIKEKVIDSKFSLSIIYLQFAMNLSLFC